MEEDANAQSNSTATPGTTTGSDSTPQANVGPDTSTSATPVPDDLDGVDDIDPDRSGDGPIQWRRDASTSRTIWLLWSLGVGTFFATISIIVFWRVYDLAGQTGGQSVIVALTAAIVVTTLVLILAGNTEQRVRALADSLPVPIPSGRSLERAIDAAIGTLIMAGVIGSLMLVGRYVSQNELLATGAGPFTGLAALFIPLALVALVLASFLRSIGALDREEQAIYLYDPEQAIDLHLIESVSTRQIGDTVVLTFEYAKPDGTYVAGPRRLAVPPVVATEIEGLIASSRTEPTA
ncbi:uncharacterized protein Nmag_1714 [Natrialba magadii ATCC 43099]|uniref:Uncharacterized protein n=1 Tax=Natrialba magadii (strain ATCC 43099 / DSM 3394 / CCM 3739 / CIP 104546 / IAM 13178 / JCM 8861 / NBRC 102185 / NCIMB 2190 / MS3) TaxID=547559 RepID=D3SUN2_NATMM|nr:hypothetical protein [Natrialba magadii]ADD05290.1 uncharacterized protein Nmag_1714 [Natrialba magadii ATCC 43099]ELY29161.1 hypothetical protein C500_11775 [Natrialba magadii ATCC 43099]